MDTKSFVANGRISIFLVLKSEEEQQDDSHNHMEAWEKRKLAESMTLHWRIRRSECVLRKVLQALI